MIILQKCTKCGNEKPLTDFRRQTGTRTGYQYACRICSDEMAKNRYESKSSEIIAKNLEYQKRNTDKHLAANQKYYNSPLGKMNRRLNRRLDQILGKERSSFLQIIGASCSVLFAHLIGTLSPELKAEDYGTTWRVGLIEPDNYHWKNLTAKEKNTRKDKDLTV